MMKRLLLLTAVAMLTASATGCRCCDWLWRGAACPTSATPVMVADPCNPCSPCSPCTTPAPMSACESAASCPGYVQPSGM